MGASHLNAYCSTDTSNLRIKGPLKSPRASSELTTPRRAVPSTYILTLIVAFLSLLIINCADDGAGEAEGGSPFHVRLIETSTTELFVGVHVDDPGFTSPLLLLRNGQPVVRFMHAPYDTTFHDIGLSEAQTYVYRLATIVGKETVMVGNIAPLTTLGRSSNAYQWQTFEFGDGYINYLVDAVITGDRSVWAVGEVNSLDSTGAVNYPPSNIVRIRDGKIEFESLQFQHDWGRSYSSGESIFGLGGNELVVGGASSVMRWNGFSWGHVGYLTTAADRYGSSARLWGTSRSDLFAGGEFGLLAHWDGKKWTALSSGVDGIISDMTGARTAGGETEIVYYSSTAWSWFWGNAIVGIRNSSQGDSLPWPKERHALTVWTRSGAVLFAGGAGVMTWVDGRWSDTYLGGYLITRIRGNALNDVFAVGRRGFIGHFDGASWEVLQEGTGVDYDAVAVQPGMIAAVGAREGKAVVTIGTRIVP
jgi:hypothetical protein